MKKSVLVFLIASVFMLMHPNAFSQKIQGQPLDGVYNKYNTPNREPIPYPPIREADVAWGKYIWRIIDLRQKINLPFYYPTTELKGRQSLMQVIMKGITEGDIVAYSPTDDEFTTPLTKEDLYKRLNKEKVIKIVSEDGLDERDSTIYIPFNTADVLKIRVKEYWFFDKQRSVMDVRIIGMCPVKDDLDDNGDFRGYSPLFWIYFPDCRKRFANSELYNRWNDAERRTFDDVFFKRQFGSYIYKESNVYDRQIDAYTKGMDGLLEAERVKDELFTKEHDLWEY